MFKGWTHRVWRRAAVVLAIVPLGVAAFVSAGSAAPRVAQNPTAGEASLATHVLSARLGSARVAHLAVAVPAGHILGAFLGKNLDPVVAELTNRGKKLQISIGFEMACSPSGNQFNSNDWAKVKLAKNGSFHANALYSPQGNFQGGTDTFSGKYDRKHNTLTGTWALHLIFTIQNGTTPTTDTCDSGPVKFKLSN
jgi:hypothetical protein